MLSITKTITGNAVSRQVKRAKQTVVKELGKTGTNMLAKATMVTGLTTVLTDFAGTPVIPWALFLGTILSDGLLRNDPKLDSAINKYKSLKSGDEYKQIAERAKKIK